MFTLIKERNYDKFNLGNEQPQMWTIHCQNNQPVGLFIRNLLPAKSIYYGYEETNIILYETLNYEAKRVEPTGY